MASKKFNINDFLNDKSKSDADASFGRSFTIERIHIDKIIPSDKNRYDVGDIETLAASIESMGLMHNLVVSTPDADGNHILVSGERRYRAFRLLYENGNPLYEFLPCKIEPPENSTESELKLIYANATARVLTDYEKTYQASRIKELLKQMRSDGYRFEGRMREIVAGMLDVSPAQMGRMESINNHLAPGFKEAFRNGKIRITDAYELSTKPESEQAAALDQYNQTGALLKSVRKITTATPDASSERDDSNASNERTDAILQHTRAIAQLTNHEKRLAFLDTWETWPVWAKCKALDLTVYRYDLPDGSAITAAHYAAVNMYHNHKFMKLNHIGPGKGFNPNTQTQNYIADIIKDIRNNLNKQT